jgi:adenylate cyclase
MPEREHREIERKFLVRQLPDDLARHPQAEIEQGYLALGADGVQVRLRKTGAEFSLTHKRNRGNAREEREVPLTREQFEVLWPATADRRLCKTRYDVPLGQLVVEVDIYRGRHEGLVVAEVEFADEEKARAFRPPPWLGDDVSHDPRYSNQLLAS